MSRFFKTILFLIVLIVVVPMMFLFIVDQRQYAIVFQLGEIKEVIKEPGLHWKWPVIQNIRYFDRRIMTLESPGPEMYFTSEKMNVLVDSFVKWRIADPRLYYESVSGDEQRARIRLAQTVNDGLRGEFSKRTVHGVISGERDKIMAEMRGKANEDSKKIGVEIVDVRLKRVDYTPAISESVYRRMEAERERVAKELRSQGGAQAEKIRAEADRTRDIIEAEAYRDAQKVKGEGDASAAAIYAAAYNRHPEFYAFYRSLEAYRNSFASKNDLIVVEPEGNFFKYLHNFENTD